MNVKQKDGVLSEGERVVLMVYAEDAGRKFIEAVMGRRELKEEELEAERATSSFIRGIAREEWDISHLSEGERLALGLLLEKTGL